MKYRSNLSELRKLLDLRMHSQHLAFFAGIQFTTPLPQREMFGKDGRWTMRWQDAARDVWRLKVLNDFCTFNTEGHDYLNERINGRAALWKTIQANTRDGKVTVEESGRDCDCVSYSGNLHEIDATLYAYEKLYKDTAKWADGPFHFSIVPPDEVDKIEYKSRDNMLEAFEDGHPHSVVIRSPE